MYKNIEFYQAQKDIEELKNRPIPESCDCSSINYVKTVEELTTILTDPDTPRYIDIYLLPHTRFVLTETIISGKFVRIYGNYSTIDATNVKYGIWLGVVYMENLNFYDNRQENLEFFIGTEEDCPYPSSYYTEISVISINLGINGLIRNCNFSDDNGTKGMNGNAKRYSLVIWSGINCVIEGCEFKNSAIKIEGILNSIKDCKLDNTVLVCGGIQNEIRNCIGYLCNVLFKSGVKVINNNFKQTMFVTPMLYTGDPDVPVSTGHVHGLHFVGNSLYNSNIVLSDKCLYNSRYSSEGKCVVFKDNDCSVYYDRFLLTIYPGYGHPMFKYTSHYVPPNFVYNAYSGGNDGLTIECINNGPVFQIGLYTYVDRVYIDGGKNIHLNQYRVDKTFPPLINGSNYLIERFGKDGKCNNGFYFQNKFIPNENNQYNYSVAISAIAFNQIKEFKDEDFIIEIYKNSNIYLDVYINKTPGEVLNVEENTGIITNEHIRYRYQFGPNWQIELHTVTTNKTTHAANSNVIKYLEKNEDGTNKNPTVNGVRKTDLYYDRPKLDLSSEIVPLSGAKYFEYKNITFDEGQVNIVAKYAKINNCSFIHSDYNSYGNGITSCINITNHCEAVEVCNCYFEKKYIENYSQTSNFKGFVGSENPNPNLYIELVGNKYHMPDKPEFNNFTQPMHSIPNINVIEERNAGIGNYYVSPIDRF